MEAYIGLGGDMLSAVDKTNKSLGLASAEDQPAVAASADNDAALRELERATSGLKRRK